MLFKNLPRQTFGRVQSKLFPIYFFINAACISVCLGTSMARGDLASWAVPSLGAAFVSTLLNIFWLEPATTSCMFSMYALENDGKKESEVSCMFSMESDGKRESEVRFGIQATAQQHLRVLSTFVCLSWALHGPYSPVSPIAYPGQQLQYTLTWCSSSVATFLKRPFKYLPSRIRDTMQPSSRTPWSHCVRRSTRDCARSLGHCMACLRW